MDSISFRYKFANRNIRAHLTFVSVPLQNLYYPRRSWLDTSVVRIHLYDADLEYYSNSLAEVTCRRFLQGICVAGDTCRFTHSETKRNSSPLLNLGSPATSNLDTNGHVDLNLISRREWKTTLCRHYARSQGWCPLGEKCRL